MNRNDGQKPETDSIGRFFMEQYFADLIPELNLRLLCEKQADTDAFLPPERLFWIEDMIPEFTDSKQTEMSLEQKFHYVCQNAFWNGLKPSYGSNRERRSPCLLKNIEKRKGR